MLYIVAVVEWVSRLPFHVESAFITAVVLGFMSCEGCRFFTRFIMANAGMLMVSAWNFAMSSSVILVLFEIACWMWLMMRLAR